MQGLTHEVPYDKVVEVQYEKIVEVPYDKVVEVPQYIDKVVQKRVEVSL